METDDEGEVRLTYYPEKLIPVAEYLGLQGRFKQISEPRFRGFKSLLKTG